MTQARTRELSVERGAGLAFALALLATLLMALPVVVAPTERIFGSGEILSRADPNRDALVVIDQFRTGRVPPPYLQPLTDLPGRFLARAFGPVIAYNLVVLATFPLAAATAYLLGRHLLGSHLAALVAGLSYAFMPFHLMQAGGHPHIAQIQWLPLYFLALSRGIESPTMVRAGLLVLSVAATASADFYAGFIIAVLTPVGILAFALASPKAPGAARWRGAGVTALILGAALATGVAAVRRFLPDVMARADTLSFPRADLFSWSAKWWSYLVPPADHPLWGGTVRDFWTAQGVGVDLLEHQQISVALSLVLLACVPLWRFAREPHPRTTPPIAPALALLGAAALLCSLSPGRTIGSFTFVRPSAFLYELAPMFRAYARFGVVVGLVTSLLGGLGAALLWRTGGWRRRAAIGLVALALIEYAPIPARGSRDVLPTHAHRWLASQLASSRVLDCVEPARFSDTLAVPLLGHEVTFLGTAGIDDCGEQGLGSRLATLGINRVIVRSNTPVGRWRSRSRADFAVHTHLAPEVDFGDAAVLRPALEPGTAQARGWSGFFPREYEGDATWRWMSTTGELRITMSQASTQARLRVELRSFPGPRRVDWFINGEKGGELSLTPDWRVHTLNLARRAAGDFTLTLVAEAPAVVAHDALANHDHRGITVAVRSWSIEDHKH